MLKNGGSQDCICSRLNSVLSAMLVASLRLRFSTRDDIALLREMHVANGLGGPARWATIAGNLPLATHKRFSAKVGTRDLSCRVDTSGPDRSTSPIAFSYLNKLKCYSGPKILVFFFLKYSISCIASVSSWRRNTILKLLRKHALNQVLNLALACAKIAYVILKLPVLC